MQLLKDKTTISSLELVEQINIFRREDENKNDLAHSDLLKVIRDEFEEEIGMGNISYTPYIHPQNGQEYKMFDLTLNQAKQVLVRESKIVRKAVVAYIEKMEKKLADVQPKLPSNYLEALKLLVVKEEENIKLIAETTEQKGLIKEQAPKVEFYNQIADTTTSFDMQEVSAMLKLTYGRNILFRKLREANVLMSDNLPYREHINNGYLLVVETKWMNPKTDQSTATFQTRITQKGLEWLQKGKVKMKL
jgi:anti-repressor protein